MPFCENRTLIVLIVVLTIIFGIATISLFFKLHSDRPKVCNSKSCILAANMILQNINMNIDPCEDFFEFSCGSFIQNKRIPDDQSRVDMFDGLRDTLSYNVADLLAEPINTGDIESVRNAKKLYKSCMNEDLIENYGEDVILKYIQHEFGGWNILNNNNYSILTSMDKLVKLRLLNVKPFFDFDVQSNPKNSSLTVLRLKQAGWLFNRDMYNDTRAIKLIKNVILKWAQYMNSTNDKLNNDIDKMIEVMKNLGLSQTEGNTKRNLNFKNMSIKELQEKIPNFDWFEYIRRVLEPYQINATENETIIVYDLNYLGNVSALYSDLVSNSSKDLDNLLIWTFLLDKSNYLPKKYKQARLELDKMSKGIQTIPTNTMICSELLTDSLEYVVGRMYVKKHFVGKSKDSATEMVSNIQNEFKTILKEVEWMDKKSKENALEKADAIDTKIGYPEWIMNDTELNDYYKTFNFSENELFMNHIEIAKVSVATSFLELKKIRNTKNWFIGPAVVNAFYSPAANQICFPAGILQEPFFHASNPNYLNYGGIGSVIGHEITHGFDDRGRMFDKNGIYFADGEEGLWSNETIQNYLKKVQCIIEQYDNYTIKQINLTLNGINTQGENIADNGGVKESYRAYMNWVAKNGEEPILPGLDFNAKQLFFINYGQLWCGKYRDQYLVTRIINGLHSPGEFRIKGPTSNLEEFANAFKCI